MLGLLLFEMLSGPYPTRESRAKAFQCYFRANASSLEAGRHSELRPSSSSSTTITTSSPSLFRLHHNQRHECRFLGRAATPDLQQLMVDMVNAADSDVAPEDVMTANKALSRIPAATDAATLKTVSERVSQSVSG
eukprot:GHVU01039300.1.p1 GENE.GHVU01039300.1~~GHVU01039300.1.p1  ORF type:complete len:135 (-),score=30.01 GHVU01039300.1:115-519(-)